ncbi:MAG: hypothetical protein WCG01_02000 [bacterium]
MSGKYKNICFTEMLDLITADLIQIKEVDRRAVIKIVQNTEFFKDNFIKEHEMLNLEYQEIINNLILLFISNEQMFKECKIKALGQIKIYQRIHLLVEKLKNQDRSVYL